MHTCLGRVGRTLFVAIIIIIVIPFPRAKKGDCLRTPIYIRIAKQDSLRLRIGAATTLDVFGGVLYVFLLSVLAHSREAVGVLCVT
ncbi:hypothetical protein BDW02DRAFT_256397 [Decorospora gaudefroyi]|uniref:Uncharacterized protein n=1 Tax=Decorospora gaudefroyi TaxID=184978 RepID=A0A6A5KJK2_9PLEO|nr:hypothetical protein BDW02DRAFT_256397 [Decorospora gaudefroyi]